MKCVNDWMTIKDQDYYLVGVSENLACSYECMVSLPGCDILKKFSTEGHPIPLTSRKEPQECLQFSLAHFKPNLRAYHQSAHKALSKQRHSLR